MIVSLIIVCFLLSVLLSWLYMLFDCKRMNMPGPRPWPILGNALNFLGDSSHFISTVFQLSNDYGPVLRAHLFNQRYVLFSHPDYIEPLISSTEYIVKGRSYRFLLPWLGQGLLTAAGHRWRTHRKFLTPAFHFNILQNFMPVFCKNARILGDKISAQADGRPVSLFPMVALAALDNMTESIMGVCCNAQKDSESEYVKSIEILSELVSMKMRNPVIAEDFIFNLTPLKIKQDKALKVLHGHTNRVINSRREELRKNNIISLPADSENGIKNKHAFLDLLLLSEIDGEKISDVAIREEVDTFMFEGHDTTTSGIVYALHCIAKREDIQDKILQEQKFILDDDMNRDPTYADLLKMKYLELVIKEALRLYPSVPFIERLIMQDTEINGVFIPKNTSVVVNILGLQRSPEVYEKPLEFIPERFESTLSKNAFSWISFSAGPRNCIGQKFAMMEIKIALAEIIKRFKLLPSDQEPELSADLILRSKNGVHVKFLPRSVKKY